jgi:hypothetical protein
MGMLKDNLIIIYLLHYFACAGEIKGVPTETVLAGE